MDTDLVEKIVHEVKSQGVFDEFRKDSIADVDTKPAYQNLRQRVENTVKKFLSEQKWSLETNKNQLREKLRRHITESGFLDVGVERIVDQVVNPKICSVFQPRIEEIAYKYLGVPPPPKKFEPPPPPLMHPLPPLPLNAPPLKIETSSLLPTDLEQVSPDSDSATVKSEVKEDRDAADMDADEDESPPFEPLINYEEQDAKESVKVEVKKEAAIELESEVSLNESANKCEESSDAQIKPENIANNNDSIETSSYAIEDKEASQSVDPRISQDSQLSSVSSDSCLSPNVKEDSMQSSSQENVAANISEEAQMPQFNENSCEPNVANGNICERDRVKSELHFDIKKDEIKFEGTERKTGMEVFESLAGKSEEKRYSHNENISPKEDKQDSFNFNADKLNREIKEDEGERTPNAQELSFGSSVDDSSSVPTSHTPRNSNHRKEKDETPQAVQALKEAVRPTTPTTAPINMQYLPSPVAPQYLEKDYQKRSSSSSKHKKHSKERRRSYEREKEAKERHRSGRETKDSSKYHHGSGIKSSHKYSSSSSSNKYYSSHSRGKEKDVEKYCSSSAQSSSKHTKHSHSHSSSSPIESLDLKKSKRDSDRRHHSSSSSSSKRSDKKDDHHEAKQKIQRRKTSDSNDDDDGNKGGGKSGQHYKSSSSSYGSKSSKPSYNDNKPSTNKTSDYQKDQMGYKDSVEDTTDNLPINNFVILNDLLENPHTQFIQLNNKGHLVEMPFQQNNSSTKAEGTTSVEGNEIFALEFNNNLKLHSMEEKHSLEKDDVCLVEREKEQTFACQNNETEKGIENIIEENKEDTNDLLYFEETQTNFVERLSLINATMDLCRSAVNSLRFDSLSDEGIELSNEEDITAENSKIELLTNTLKRKSEYSYENYTQTPRKRFIRNEFEDCQTKSSPTPSDSSSVNSKENEEICKNTNRAKKSLLDQHKANQKLSQQQRYSSEDLYKPRPVLGQRSRRRGMDSLV